MSEKLKEEVGYIIFIYKSAMFYIKTSLNPDKCPVKPGFFYDIQTGRLVPRSLIAGVHMDVQMEEPGHLKPQSDFWKSLLLEDTATYA